MSQIWDRPSRLPQATITMLRFIWMGWIYHASGQAGVVGQEAADFFESNHFYDLYVYPEMDIQSVKEKACKHLGAPYNTSFYPDGASFYCSQYMAEILPIFETIPMKFGDGK